MKDIRQVLKMVNPHPSKAIEDAWIPPSKQVRHAFSVDLCVSFSRCQVCVYVVNCCGLADDTLY